MGLKVPFLPLFFQEHSQIAGAHFYKDGSASEKNNSATALSKKNFPWIYENRNNDYITKKDKTKM